VTRALRAWAPLGVAATVLVGALLAASIVRNSSASIEQRTQEIAAGLRCPVCQNLSVADSPSGLAAEMRSSIEQRLRAGETPEQIRAFFVQRYGEWVLLEPPRRGFDLVPWLVPIAALALGLWLWVRSLGRSREVEDAGEEVSA
jgi:cytochrome c-type biogenesis protein CcmH